MNQALAMVVTTQVKLPMSGVWGMGTSASSDDQFFPTARHGEAINRLYRINGKGAAEVALSVFQANNR